MKYNGIVQRKLGLLAEKVLQLQSISEARSLKDFQEDYVLQAAVERLLQVSAEIIIDTSERILSLEGYGPATSASDALSRLQDLNVLDDASRYQSIVRFRNLIVHEYERINPTILHDICSTRLPDLLHFRDEILAHE